MKESVIKQMIETRFVSLEICLKDLEHTVSEQADSIDQILNTLEEEPYKDVLNSIDESLKYIVNRAKGKD
jgi:uncharacterized coiled-coil protein SlyX